MEVAPQPTEGGYIHPHTRFETALRQQIEAVGLLIPKSRRELEEFRNRDVGANPAPPLVAVREDTYHEMVSIAMDARTAAVVMYAVQLMASSEEAHAREVRRAAVQMEDDSYSQRNRILIAVRRERVARRLRAVEHAYRDASTTEYHGI